MKPDKKKKIVSDLHERFSRLKILILTDYKGLDVQTVNDLRRKLTEAKVEYQVVKNSLMARASEGTDAELIKTSFKGPSAVALGYDDPVAPAKVLTEFAKEHNNLEIKIGVMDGNILDLNSIKTLSALPSREQLLAHLMATINGVPATFVRILNEIPRKFLNVLQAVKEQKEAA